VKRYKIKLIFLLLQVSYAKFRLNSSSGSGLGVLEKNDLLCLSGIEPRSLGVPFGNAALSRLVC
jgi:hypothetical protein